VAEARLEPEVVDRGLLGDDVPVLRREDVQRARLLVDGENRVVQLVGDGPDRHLRPAPVRGARQHLDEW
jgi:hypothetical protein